MSPGEFQPVSGNNAVGEDPRLLNVKSQNVNKNRTDPTLIFVSSS